MDMTFGQLQQAVQEYDEIMPIGREVVREDKTYHFIGMARRHDRAQLYIMEYYERERAAYRPDIHRSNRERTKSIPRYPESYFSNIAAIQADGKEFAAESAVSGPFAVGSDYDWESVLVFAKMMEAGWCLSEESVFARADWRNIWISTIVFRMGEEKLPDWKCQEIKIKLRREAQIFYIEKPLCLTVGEENETAFSLEDGRTGICYINKVYPIDVWKENEERFKDPRYLEFVTREELEKQKEEFFQGLEQDCPRGMCYLGIEYECTLKGSLQFYDRNYLEAEPVTHNGSARAMMMLLKPDEQTGKHGIRQYGCVIQTPLPPDVKQVEAELFSFMETIPESEEIL